MFMQSTVCIKSISEDNVEDHNFPYFLGIINKRSGPFSFHTWSDPTWSRRHQNRSSLDQIRPKFFSYQYHLINSKLIKHHPNKSVRAPNLAGAHPGEGHQFGARTGEAHQLVPQLRVRAHHFFFFATYTMS